MSSKKYQMPDHIREARRKCLTGTDMAALAGYDPRKTLSDIWIEKRNPKITINGEFNERMEAGLRAETMIAEWYEDKTGATTVPTIFVQKGIYGGTPDRLAADADGEYIVELKTANNDQAYYWGEEGTDQVPMHYLIQCAWYMFLLDKPRCDIAVLVGGSDFRIYHLKRDMDLETKLVKLADKFWEKYIVGNETPKIGGSDNFRNYLQQKYQRGNGIKLPADEDVFAKAKEFEENKIKIADLEERQKTIRNQLCFLIGENDGLIGDGLRVMWTPVKPREKIDYDALLKDLGVADEVLAKYKQEGKSYRRFMIDLKK